jgi:hypothetical protein
MRAREISALIDETYQLVGRRTSKLRDMQLVHKEESSADGKMTSVLTKKARETYF